MGSNIGERTAHLDDAVRRLGDINGVRVLTRSSNYLTKPVGHREQRDFFNCVIETATLLSPADLLAALKTIEKDMGREPTIRWGPRIIDLDILLYDDDMCDEDDLKIPHPEMHRRLFVLDPLAEIAPEAEHPVLGKTARQMLAELAGGEAED